MAAGMISKAYFDSSKSEAFQEALEKGEDFDTADLHSDILGAFDGALEGIGDFAMMGIAKVGTAPASKAMKNAIIGSVEKILKNKAVEAPVKTAVKNVARHSSVFKTAAKGFLAEGPFEETVQNVLGDEYRNAIGWQDKTQADIWADGLFSGFVGGITGAGFGAGGTILYNRRMRKWNQQIKEQVRAYNPNIDDQTAQTTADLLQETFLQEGAPAMDTLDQLLNKEKDPDTMPEGIDAQHISEVSRQVMKERFGVTDEQIDEWAKIVAPMIDARNQYNEVYQNFYEHLTAAGRPNAEADADARIIAARAVTLAVNEGKSATDILQRWQLKIEDGEQGSAVYLERRPEQNLEQSMYKSPIKDFGEFYDDILKHPEKKKRYFSHVMTDGTTVDVMSDIIAHDQKHNMTAGNWQDVLNNIDSVENFAVSDKPRFDGQPVLVKIATPNGKYGVVFEHMRNGRNIITTAFQGTDKSIDTWMKKETGKSQSLDANAADTLSSQPTAQEGENQRSVAIVSQQSEISDNPISNNTNRSFKDIITEIDSKVNDTLYQFAGEKAQTARYDTETGVLYQTGAEFGWPDYREIEASEPYIGYKKYAEDVRSMIRDDVKYADLQMSINRVGGISSYISGETKDGEVFRIRLSDHDTNYDTADISFYYGANKDKFIERWQEFLKQPQQRLAKSEQQEAARKEYVAENLPKEYIAYYRQNGLKSLKKAVNEGQLPTFRFSFNNEQQKIYGTRGVSWKDVETFINENDNIYYQTAYAGSRVDYDRPSLQAIGTGEGAQVHGWGLYYALNKDVAERYRRKFAPDERTAVYYKGKEINFSSPLYTIYTNFAPTNNEIKRWLELKVEKIEKGKEYGNVSKLKEALAIVDEVNLSEFDEKLVDAGQLHEVNVPENPYLLDEQKPLNEQSSFVKKALRNVAKEVGVKWDSEHTNGKYIYDNVTNVLGSKQAASEILEKHGIKGITYEGQQDGRCFVIFNPDDVQVLDKFYQMEMPSDRELNLEVASVRETAGENSPQGARGSFTRRPDTGEAIIKLFQTADASTVVHELGHFFLDDMRRFADNPETEAQLQAIYRYVGALDGNLNREQHEYFARSFEAYLLDGRSPNTLLKKVFRRFKSWLRGVYGEIKALNVDLDDNIRKTFDDMLGGRKIDFAMQQSGVNMREKLKQGNISPQTINKAMKLLSDGKMSKADMDDLVGRLKNNELDAVGFASELKVIEASGNINNEEKTAYDYMKYRQALSNGNLYKRDIRAKIERLVNWTKPRNEGGKLVGRFPDIKLNREFDHIRETLALTKDEALQKIAENQKVIENLDKHVEGAEGNRDALVWENKLLSIAANRASMNNLLDVYDAISDSYNSGRLSAAITGELKKARRKRLIDEAKNVLTGNGRLNWREERSGLKAFVNRLGSSQMSWNGLMDILSMNDKSSTMGKSLLNQNMDVFEAEQAMHKGIADDGENVSLKLEKALKGNNNRAISVNRYINSELQKKYTIEWSGGKKTFTKDQLIDIYMKAKDPETHEMMLKDEILQFNEDFLQEVNNNLTADDAAVAEALFEFYDENYQKINAFYEQHFGISLGKRQFYSPRSIERGGVNVETGDMISYAGFSGVKQRTAKAGALKIKGAFNALNSYIVNSNHYMAFSDKLQDINAVFGDVEIKTIVKNLFGNEMQKRIDYEISNFANNGRMKTEGWGKFFNRLRSNYAVSVLALKPALAIKQLTSLPAYWENMSAKDFVAGVADFAIHYKEAVETLGNTTLMKTRDANVIRDLEELSKTDLIKNKAKNINLRELMMANIKLGDRGAIYIGGWALYKSELKKNLAAGMKEAEAKAKALNTFERVTDETQQSGRMSQQSYWQSNSFLRAFTMFQSSQNQYLRKEINALRGVFTGRMSKKQAAKTIFIYHFLLPMLFQFVADGFRWDKDAQLRAGFFGSFNGIFILNQALEGLWDATVGEKGGYHLGLRVRDAVPFEGSIEDIIKEVIKMAEGDLDAEDWIEVLQKFGKSSGEVLGAPVKYPLDIINNFGDYAKAGEPGKEIMLWLGWSPYALRDFDEDE